MMKRKDFLKHLTAGSMGAAALGSYVASLLNIEKKEENTSSSAQDQPRMVVGCQSGGADESNLQFKARHGVYHFDPGSPATIEGVGWDLDDARRQVEACEKYGISLDAFHLSGGNSHFRLWRNIMLGESPERDREIEKMQQMIEVSATAGVNLLLYNATILPVVRVLDEDGNNEDTLDPNRGNVYYSTWNYEEAVRRGQHEEPHEAGLVDRDEMFERITYWLDRIIPVAEEYEVKMGCHIADPPLPEGYRGITRWNSPDVFEGIKQFGELYDSPAHGFNFCIGSTGEGLENPREEIYPIIEWMGERNQIFNVHYRNIKGGWNNFQEVFPDNGDMNFVGVLEKLKDVGYAGMVMPDHVPSHEDPESGRQAFAFCYGYIKALLQSMYGFDAYPDHAIDLKAPGFAIHFG